MYNIKIKNQKPQVIFISTYPPRECGIATFTHDLLKSCQNLSGSKFNFSIAAMNLSPLDTYNYPPEVQWQVDQNSKSGYKNLAKILSKDTNLQSVIIQHEYGIFGGIQGETLLSFMENCTKPMLVTLHTTLPNPNDEMRSVTKRIIELSTTIVVLTQNSKEIITNIYPESAHKIFVIPHGIHKSTYSDPKIQKAKLNLKNKIILSTFGLLSRGKGIEYALLALPEVVKKYPNLLYLILGETHPLIRRSEGESYRLELSALVTELKLEKNVKFYNQYFSLPDLLDFLKATDIYISTSIDPNQAVSGTLSYALGTGLAVISTEFPQAKEIVSKNTGRLVPMKDSLAYTNSILELLGNSVSLNKMHQNAFKMTRNMLWSNVAEEYLSLVKQMHIPELNIDHLLKMTDDFGLFQFAHLSTPNKDFGYTLDDNARALITCSWLAKQNSTSTLQNLIKVYLTFTATCQVKDGSFINYIDHKSKQPTIQNTTEDLEDCQARALWALSEVISNVDLAVDVRAQAKKIYLKNQKLNSEFTHLRSKALAIKSYALLLTSLREQKAFLLAKIEQYANELQISLNNNSIKSWRWFEKDLNYNNAILSESLLIAGKVLKNKNYKVSGLLSLEFLISKTFSDTYIPIGHSSWYTNKQKRSHYDQQPEDPASMILALVTAYKITKKNKFKEFAYKCFTWFLGNNSLRKSLYNQKSGASFDGLHPDRVNQNQGAESLVSYLISSVMIRQLY